MVTMMACERLEAAVAARRAPFKRALVTDFHDGERFAWLGLR